MGIQLYPGLTPDRACPSPTPITPRSGTLKQKEVARGQTGHADHRHFIGTMEVNDTVAAGFIDGELAEAGVADGPD
ncbi:MAG: hypothetical protein ACJ8H8_05655, partial [Geminicoccaceae bacterium]